MRAVKARTGLISHRTKAIGGRLERLEIRRLLSVATPTQLLGTSTSSNAITLTWVAPVSGVASLNVLRGQGTGTLQSVATLPAGATSYNDTGLAAGTQYTYEVVAGGTDGTTATSNPTIANTTDAFPVNPHVEPQRVGGWQWALPTNRVDALTHQRNNVFYVGQPVVFYLQWNGGGAKSYEVRDYRGNLVDQGPVPSDSSDFTLNVTNPGWYKIYIYSNTSNATFGDQIGGTTFSVFRNNANLPAMPSKAVQDSNPGQDEVVRGVTAMGPQRYAVTDVTQPAAMIAQIQPELALDEQYYLYNGTGPDPVRPRSELIAFANGTADLADPSQNATYLAGVAQIVEAFHNQIKYYEGRDEPNFFESPAQYVQEMKGLYQTIKSIDPTCQVVGPGVVDINAGYGLPWLDEFLADGGGQYIDAVSFHPYNNLNGDVFLARDSMNNLLTLLAKYGLQNLPLWQTEQGAPADVYGSFQPQQQGSWDMMQMMLYEQYGIPKEHNDLWYDRSGYWDSPDFWEVADDGQLMPIVPLMRTWSEELYGTTFTSAFDFGDPGNNLYLGDLFTGPSGKAVASFMSTGQSDGTIALNVSGGSGSGSVLVTDAFGNSKTMPVINGQVTLNHVAEAPVYIDLAPGQTVTPVPINYGLDLAMLPNVGLKTSGDGQNPWAPGAPNDISKVNDGIFQTWYENQSFTGEPWYDDTPAGQTPTFEIDLPSEQTVGHVIIYSSVPWSIRGSILDYELQYQDASGTWQNIEHYQVDPKTIGVYSPWLRSTVDSYYSGQWIFQNDFTPVNTSALRLVVNSVTWGGGATAEVVQAGGQTGPHVLSLREIQVFGPSAGQQSPTPPIPPPQPVGSSKFIKEDTTTQGNWQGVYGADGEDIVADGTNIPSYAQVSITGASPFVWGYSTTDPRAMVMPGSSNRVASTWYGSTFYADVNVTDGLTHQVALYLMDWDNGGRREKIDVIDPVTAKVETTRYLSSFQNGEYEVFQITGHVLFRITLLGGSNSVMNGLFFDPAAPQGPPAPPPPPPVNPPPPPPPAVPPTAVNDVYSLAENASLTVTAATGVLLNDTDPNNKPTAVLVNGPANAASFTFSPDGSFSFAPAANFNGSTQFTYQVRDGTAISNVATVTLQVTSVNQPPVAVDDAESTYRNQTLTLPTSTLLANDSPGPANEAGQQLTLTSITPAANTKGIVTLNANGTVTYVPPTGYIGSDSFQYTVTDNGTTNGLPDPKSATATVTVQVIARPPVAIVSTSQTSVAAGSPLTLDASVTSNPDNVPLTYQWAFGDGSTGSGATVAHVYNATGTFTATVTVSDGIYTSYAMEHVAVIPSAPPPPPPLLPPPPPPAVPPTAANDSYSVAENASVSVTAVNGVLLNDTDPANKPMTAVLVLGPANAASFTLNPDGSFAFTPAANSIGSTQFTYVANDGTLASNVATVTLQVTPVNQPPIATNAVESTYRNQTLTFPASVLLANDSAGPANESNQQLTVTAVTPAANTKGTVALNANGTITYVPLAGYIGTDTFQYTVTDNGTTNGHPDPKSATATVTVQVNGRPPVAAVATASATVIAGTPLTFDAGGSSSPDGAPLSYQWTFGDGSTGAGATVSHIYTATGTFTATVTVSDGTYTGQASEQVTVNPVPPPPPPPVVPPSVGFVGADTTTQGNWHGAYGADGEVIPGDSTNLPSYATATTSAASTYTWTGSTTDPRALQTASGATRIASTWYGGTFDIDVNITDGQMHPVSLYLLDWDRGSRSEQINLVDAATGKVLDSRSFGNFAGGEYATYNLTGHTYFQISYQAGPNTVVGGLFFGTSGPTSPPPTPPPPAGPTSAQFLGADTTTNGNWIGRYGADGYDTVAGATSLPAYAQVSVNGASEWTWNGSATDDRALQQPGSATRLAATLYSSTSFDIDVNFTDGKAHKLSAMLMNYDNPQRAEQVQVIDASTGKVLDTETANPLIGDEYLSWNVQGSVILRVTNLAGMNAVLSGLFFG